MNILITGSTGLLGSALISENSLSCAIIGIYFGRYKAQTRGKEKQHCLDILDKRALGEIFKANNIDFVIHTAGAADVDFCENEYDSAYRSNVIGTRNVIELCREYKSKLIYISTNAVFDGKNSPYNEKSRVNPVNKYGLLKLECEREIKQSLREYLIIRPILMYGWNRAPERGNLVTFVLERLSKGGEINMVTDVYENPLFSAECARAIWLLIEKNKNGIYHVAGRDTVNRYEYANAVADIFRLDKGLINPVDSGFFPAIAPRPKNTSYDTRKLEEETGLRPLGLEEGLLLMRRLKEGEDG